MAIVTGANTGIGYETALALCIKGYHVIIACRDPKRGKDAESRLQEQLSNAPKAGTPEFMALDLGNLSSVAAFAGDYVSRHSKLHCLILNAGMNTSAEHVGEKKKTADGFEICMQTNYIGHFLLVKQLLPTIIDTGRREAVSGTPTRTPCRIVTLGSVAHRLVLSDKDCDWAACFVGLVNYTYNASKLACIMLAFELQRQFDEEGITEVQALSVNPGAVLSDIWRHLPDFLRGCLRPVMSTTFLTPEQGAAPSIAAATEVRLLARLPDTQLTTAHTRHDV